MTLKDAVWITKPTMDKHGEFLFFGHPKCASTSINRHVMPSRMLFFKGHKDEYRKQWELTSEEEFFRMLRFTVVRNPYDRAVSLWQYLRKKEYLTRIPDDISFEQFVERVLCGDWSSLEFDERVRLHVRTQSSILMVDGLLTVNFIAYLEKLVEDWAIISTAVCNDVPIPKKNVTHHDEWRTYYNDTLMRMVYGVYREDFALLGYPQ